MHVHIAKAGAHRFARSLHHHGIVRCQVLRHLYDDAVFYQNIQASLRAFRIYYGSVLNQRFHFSSPSRVSRYSSAMRTATPLVTCSLMYDCGPSATSLVISTPRFNGPG